MTQRLVVAQDLVQSLVNLLSLPAKATREQGQQGLDNAAGRLKLLDAQMQAPPVPLNVPNLVPPPPVTVTT